MTITEIPLEVYVELIASGEPFVQANYGDGEIACILGDPGGNVNGELYEDELRDELRRTLIEHRPIWHGLNAAKRQEERFERWCLDNGVALPWVAKDVLSEANVRGEFAPVFEALREREVILVANDVVLAGLDLENPLLLETVWDVEIDPTRAWREADEIANDIVSLSDPGQIVLFAAGMATNLVVHRLFPIALERDLTLLDIGAILDPYAGLRTRKAYRRESWWSDAYPRNLGRTP